MPALATRGDLVQLKEHADRVLIGKLVRCWDKVAGFFGVEHCQDDYEVCLSREGSRGCNCGRRPNLAEKRLRSQAEAPSKKDRTDRERFGPMHLVDASSVSTNTEWF